MTRLKSGSAAFLKSTEWFQNEEVHVQSGVVFLTGETRLEKYRTWASDLAGKTEDVVAVVNRITVSSPPWFDAAPALQTVHGTKRKTT
ncbi:MAG TPA: BON domain-containing protein [Planctomycetaceae bacterium]|nr:BON domain-containing protein [Planctomycetaceae bacterium]